MELEFFGVQGQSQPNEIQNSFCNSRFAIDPTQTFEKERLSGYKLTVNDLESGDLLYQTDNLVLNQFKLD